MVVTVACASCGNAVGHAGGVVKCPLCGALIELPAAEEPVASEDDIAIWVSGMAEDPLPEPASEVSSCPFCGYEGQMLADGERGLTTCPACATTYAAQPAPERLPRGIVTCPNCGQPIGLEFGGADETILCPQCGCFLGARRQFEPPTVRADRARRKRRRGAGR